MGTSLVPILVCLLRHSQTILELVGQFILVGLVQVRLSVSNNFFKGPVDIDPIQQR